MKVCVLSLTRDRLDYTKTCFQSLRDNAGIDYDHIVFDNGSTDGTFDWLREEFNTGRVTAFGRSDTNIGISRAMNELLDGLDEPYDVIVKFDNDCELRTPNTLADIARLTFDYGLLLSPVIHGLRLPPRTIGGTPLSLGGHLVDEKLQIGGIFLAAPADMYETFRYAEKNPTWGGDDVQVCREWRAGGGKCGYVQGYDAWHHETTDGQHARYPDYFARKHQETVS